MILKLFRRLFTDPIPEPPSPRPPWLALVETLGTWKVPAGISYLISVKPATGVVNVILRAEHCDSVITMTPDDTLPLFITLHLHAEEALRQSELHRQALEDMAPKSTHLREALAAADAAFLKGIGTHHRGRAIAGPHIDVEALWEAAGREDRRS